MSPPMSRPSRHVSCILLVAMLAEVASLRVVGGVPGQLAHGSSSRTSAFSKHRLLAPIRCAYNPQPSKARPLKSKQPKQKTKSPGAVATPAKEETFFEGPPSITETLIPGLSVFTVVGIIPFGASIARQAWTRYKLTNRRIEVASGFQGRDVVQVLWREVSEIKWLRRYGGAAGDLVLTLKDGSKLEMRSVPEFERNLAFAMSQIDADVKADSFYPDKPALDYEDKVSRGEEPAPTLSASAEAGTAE